MPFLECNLHNNLTTHQQNMYDKSETVHYATPAYATCATSWHHLCNMESMKVETCNVTLTSQSSLHGVTWKMCSKSIALQKMTNIWPPNVCHKDMHCICCPLSVLGFELLTWMETAPAQMNQLLFCNRAVLSWQADHSGFVSRVTPQNHGKQGN